MFADVLDKKEAFKDYENNCLRKTETENFFKGVVHRFGQKFEISSTLILCKIDQEKVSGNVLVRKNFV